MAEMPPVTNELRCSRGHSRCFPCDWVSLGSVGMDAGEKASPVSHTPRALPHAGMGLVGAVAVLELARGFVLSPASMHCR